MKNIVALILFCVVSFGCVRLPSPNTSHVSYHQPNQPPAIKDASASNVAIQHAFNWYAVLSVPAGMFFIYLGWMLIQAGHLISGVCKIAVGVMLPIYFIWLSYHWLAVMIWSIIGFGLFALVTHYAVVKPILEKIEVSAINLFKSIREHIQK